MRVGAGGARTFILQRRVAGRLVKRTIGRFGVLTAEQARKDAQAMATAMAGGVDPTAERKRIEARQVTLRQATAAYLDGRDLKARTIRDVKTSMRRDFADWQALPITEIRPAMVEDRYATMVEGKASGAAAKLSFRYLRAILNFASAKFSDDTGDPILPRNPVKRLSVNRKGWTAGRRRRSFIKPSELKAWVAAVQGLDEIHLAAESRDCLMLGLLTGVRPSEAPGLRWADVDTANATITFRDTKNHSDHELPLSRWLAEMFEGRGVRFRSAAGVQRRGRNTAQGLASGACQGHRSVRRPVHAVRSAAHLRYHEAKQLDMGPYRVNDAC